MKSNIEMITVILTIFTLIPTLVSLIFVERQLRMQNKREKLELVLNLYRELFLNNRFMSILGVLDENPISKRNEGIKTIIDKTQSGADNEITEKDLISFLNYFNSLSILVENHVMTKEFVLDIFKYQIQAIFSSINLIEYIEDYQFDKMKRLVPSNFFFYGTLIDKSKRSNINDLKGINDFLTDQGTPVKLSDYVIQDQVRPNLFYPALIKSIGNSCIGNLVSIDKKASWTEIFKTLDNYEEVNGDTEHGSALYKRCIVKLDATDNGYAWAYVKS